MINDPAYGPRPLAIANTAIWFGPAWEQYPQRTTRIVAITWGPAERHAADQTEAPPPTGAAQQ